MTLVNLTDHDVVIICEGGHRITIPPSGRVAHIRMSEEAASGTIDVEGGTVRLRSAVPMVVGLPRPKAGTMYIVSSLVAIAAKRADVLAPYRRRINAEGKTVAAERLIRLQPLQFVNAEGSD